MKKIYLLLITLLVLTGIVFCQSNSLQKPEYSYAFFTIEPPVDNFIFREILNYYIGSENCDFAPRSICSITTKELKWNKSNNKTNELLLGEIQYFKNLPLIGMLVEKNKINDIQRLVNASYTFEVPQSITSEYLNIIRALDNIVDSSKYDFVNLSLQTPYPYEYNEKEAMNIATKIVVESGTIVGFSVGNFGSFGENTISPWALSPWVIGVGAATLSGDTLWEYSSIGIPGDAFNHPTLVAPGVNLPISIEGKSGHVSGTSFALPQVLNIAVRIMSYISENIGVILYFSDCKLSEEKSSKMIEYFSELPPEAVKYILEDMAKPMEGYKEYEVGAGFIDTCIMKEYLDNISCEKLIDIYQHKK